MTTEKRCTKTATVYAVAIEIWCPASDCDRDDPIPATDGSFMWDRKPETVKCPDCGRTWRVGSKITF